MIITNNTFAGEDITITGLYFQNKRGLKAFPRRMEYHGDTYTFRDGLQYLVRKGQEVTRIFDMTDGEAQYRLQSDAEQNNWTLLGISPSA
jgi:hypothetical protein